MSIRPLPTLLFLALAISISQAQWVQTDGLQAAHITTLTTSGDYLIRLWKSDGTAEGTQKIEKFFSTPTNLTDVNGVLFYSAFANGKELCKYESGTTRVAHFESKIKSGISLYLTAGKLRISMPSSTIATARLSGLRGNAVKNIILKSTENEISIDDLPNAFYLLKVTTPSVSLVQKINMTGPRN